MVAEVHTDMCGAAGLSNQLKLIVSEGDFQPVKGENNIYSAISEQSDDFDNLINAARNPTLPLIL